MTSIRDAFRAAFGEDVAAGRKTGPTQHRVRCAFQEDHHPSLDVDVAKNVYACRSVNCGAHGGVLDLIVAAGYAGDHREAAQWLRRRGL